MNVKTIGIIFVAIVAAYFIMSPYQNCLRNSPYSSGAASNYCQSLTSW
jgi:hypothetical protein